MGDPEYRLREITKRGEDEIGKDNKFELVIVRLGNVLARDDHRLSLSSVDLVDEALRRMSVSSNSVEQAMKAVRLHIRREIRVQQLAAAMINEAVHAPKGRRTLLKNKLRKKGRKSYN